MVKLRSGWRSMEKQENSDWTLKWYFSREKEEPSLTYFYVRSGHLWFRKQRELKQRRRTSTGSESFSLSTRLDDIKFVLLCFFTLKETIWLKIFGETTAQECKKSTSGWRASLKLPKHYSTSLPHSPPATHTHKHAPTIHCEPSSCAQVTIRKRLHYKVRVNGNGF